MRKFLIAKGNLHNSDHMRALLTDTLPGDVPIVISNDGFYQNMKPTSLPNAAQREFVDKVLREPPHYTIPYRYSILRPSGSPRRLSLMHPSGQLGVVQLYQDYGELICYFCRKSDASIRSPQKIGSTFFVRGSISEKNKIKGSRIDTVQVENSVSNPASYFSYYGVDRAFKFFSSADYMRLEKRYSTMHFADISKCFNSIYTHTLFWAIADTKTAKDNIRAKTFSNQFDRLMQSVNYNETNGICIGAEVSRIFAELILSDVDRNVLQSLESKGLKFKVDYEFRRYVDDFYVFSKNPDISTKVLAAISACLSEFNLHLNDQKTYTVPRPFITPKSRMIRDANRTLEEFFDKFIRTAQSGMTTFSYPVRIRRERALLRMLLESVKSSCFDHKSEYNATSNYIISSLASRVGALIDGYEAAKTSDIEIYDTDYVNGLLLLLEAIYFFYNVDPTVPSSLRVAQASITAFKFLENAIPERKSFLAEQIVRWTHQFIRELSGTTKHEEHGCVPLEAINVLLVLGEVGQGEILARQAIFEFCDDVSHLGYFEIVSYLFCMGNNPAFDALRTKLFERAAALLDGPDKLRDEAEAAHLGFDILSCPHISAALRGQLFNKLRQSHGLQSATAQETMAAIAEFEKSPWFVDWRGANLLTMIRKKELSAVY